MKTQEIVDVRVGESTQPDYGYELSDRCIITKSSNAVASGAGSKGLFSYKSTKLLNVKSIRVYGMLIMEQEAKVCLV